MIEDNAQLFPLMREADVAALENFAVNKLGLDRSSVEWESDLPARTRHIYKQIGIEKSYWPDALR